MLLTQIFINNNRKTFKLLFKLDHTLPVNGTAVNKRREHSASNSKVVANWTHTQRNVQIVFDSFDEEIVQGQWRSIYFSTLQHFNNIK